MRANQVETRKSMGTSNMGPKMVQKQFRKTNSLDKYNGSNKTRLYPNPGGYTNE